MAFARMLMRVAQAGARAVPGFLEARRQYEQDAQQELSRKQAQAAALIQQLQDPDLPEQVRSIYSHQLDQVGQYAGVTPGQFAKAPTLSPAQALSKITPYANTFGTKNPAVQSLAKSYGIQELGPTVDEQKAEDLERSRRWQRLKTGLDVYNNAIKSLGTVGAENAMAYQKMALEKVDQALQAIGDQPLDEGLAKAIVAASAQGTVLPETHQEFLGAAGQDVQPTDAAAASGGPLVQGPAAASLLGRRVNGALDTVQTMRESLMARQPAQTAAPAAPGYVATPGQVATGVKTVIGARQAGLNSGQMNDLGVNAPASVDQIPTIAPEKFWSEYSRLAESGTLNTLPEEQRVAFYVAGGMSPAQASHFAQLRQGMTPKERALLDEISMKTKNFELAREKFAFNKKIATQRAADLHKSTEAAIRRGRSAVRTGGGSGDTLARTSFALRDQADSIRMFLDDPVKMALSGESRDRWEARANELDAQADALASSANAARAASGMPVIYNITNGGAGGGAGGTGGGNVPVHLPGGKTYGLSANQLQTAVGKVKALLNKGYRAGVIGPMFRADMKKMGASNPDALFTDVMKYLGR